jgi:hypothetical protein
MKLKADFNGIFAMENGGLLLCLSHDDTCRNEFDEEIPLSEGMTATAFDEDIDVNGERDDLIADGVVTKSPEWLRCNGSKWSLILDENGWYHRSDMPAQKALLDQNDSCTD